MLIREFFESVKSKSVNQNAEIVLYFTDSFRVR